MDMNSIMQQIRSQWNVTVTPDSISLHGTLPNQQDKTISRITSPILHPGSIEVAINGNKYRVSKKALLKAAEEIWNEKATTSFQKEFATEKSRLAFATRLLNLISHKPTQNVTSHQLITPETPSKTGTTEAPKTSQLEKGKSILRESCRDLLTKQEEAPNRSAALKQFHTLGSILAELSAEEAFEGTPVGLISMAATSPQLAKKLEGVTVHFQTYQAIKKELQSLSPQDLSPTTQEKRTDCLQRLTATRNLLFKDVKIANSLVSHASTLLTSVNSGLAVADISSSAVGTILEGVGFATGVITTGVGVVGIVTSSKRLSEVQKELKTAEAEQKKELPQILQPGHQKTLSTCEALKQYDTDKKIRILKAHQRKQILLIAKNSIKTLVGILAIGLSIAGIVATGGIAALAIPLALVIATAIFEPGGGVLGMLSSKATKASKKIENEGLPQVLRDAGIKDISDLASLAHSLHEIPEKDQESLLEYLGLQNIKDLSKNEELLANALMVKFASAFSSQSVSVMASSLRAQGILCHTPSQVAEEIGKKIHSGDPALLATFLFRHGVTKDLSECQTIAQHLNAQDAMTKQVGIDALAVALRKNCLYLFQESGRELFEKFGLRPSAKTPQDAAHGILHTVPNKKNFLLDVGLCATEEEAKMILQDEQKLTKLLGSDRFAYLFTPTVVQ